MLGFINILAIEPLALQGNIRLATAILYGMLLGVLLVKFDFSDRTQIKQELTFCSIKMTKTLLLALGLGMITFAFLRNQHFVQANLPDANFWGVLVGGICCGIGLGIGGLTPLTVITSLAAGRLYAVWFIAGMIAAFPAAGFLKQLLKDSLKSFSSPVAAVMENTTSIWSLNNPYLWVSALLILLCIIMQLFGPRESK